MNQDALHYRHLLQEDLDQVNALLATGFDDIPDVAREPIRTLILSGGKRLRPALVLLSSYACSANHAQALFAAAGVEMLHTATLIHDDLIDSTLVRRGVVTLNSLWSPMTTVLAGDYVFALAAKMIARSDNTGLVTRFAETLATICSGELDQIFSRNGTLPSFEAYYRRIFAKTASLFALCMEVGPILACRPPEELARARQIGRRLGEAFQIADDVLDLMGSESLLGKPVGNDLRQGVITLPVLRYAQQQPQDERLRAVLDHNSDEAVLGSLIADVRSSDAAEWAMKRAEVHAQEALELARAYPDTPHRTALEEIIRFSVRRQF